MTEKPRLTISNEDKRIFEEMGHLASRFVHTCIDSLSEVPTMTRRGLVRRFEERSMELTLLLERLHREDGE